MSHRCRPCDQRLALLFWTIVCTWLAVETAAIVIVRYELTEYHRHCPHSKKSDNWFSQIYFHFPYRSLSKVECYDPHTNKWTLRAPMNRRRGGVGVAVVNGFLYALGGHDSPASNPAGCSRTDTVERYDPATDTWTLVSSIWQKNQALFLNLLRKKILQ